MASFQISVRIAGPGKVRSKLKIASAENEPFPTFEDITLESNLVDARSHRLRIRFNSPPDQTAVEPPIAAEPNNFWERIRSRLGGIQLRLPL